MALKLPKTEELTRIDEVFPVITISSLLTMKHAMRRFCVPRRITPITWWTKV
jgi:hypothetical protein